MRYVITADTHLGHQMLFEKGYRHKYYEADIMRHLKMNQGIANILIHLGDVALCRSSDAERQWNHMITLLNYNKKILVLGNHDSRSDDWYYEQGWDFVCRQFLLKKYSMRILFSHKPRTDRGYFDINIHGHLHGDQLRIIEPEIQERLCDKHVLVAQESSGYKPIFLQTIIKEYLEEHEFLNKKGRKIQI